MVDVTTLEWPYLIEACPQVAFGHRGPPYRCCKRKAPLDGEAGSFCDQPIDWGDHMDIFGPIVSMMVGAPLGMVLMAMLGEGRD